MADTMTFPNTWDEFEQFYGITDTEEIYTNGSRLIPSFRVKQWLDHIAQNTDLSDFCDRLWRGAYNRGYERCRQDAIEAICKACSMEGDYHKCDGYPETSTWCDELVALRALPPAQPERKKGRWEVKSFHEVFCNKCGFDFDIMANDIFDKMYFCPNCGAEMRGDSDEETGSD